MIVAPNVSSHASFLATAPLMNGRQPKGGDGRAVRCRQVPRQLANDVEEEHDADLVAVVPDFVLERVVEDQAGSSTQCSMRLPTRIRAAVSSAGVRSAR